MRVRLRRALVDAMKARDTAAISALRSALAAIDNAEAVDTPSAPTVAATSTHVAASVAGLGAAEAQRRNLTEADVEAVVRSEMTRRLASAEDYERLGRDEYALRLRSEADVLRGHLLSSAG